MRGIVNLLPEIAAPTAGHPDNLTKNQSFPVLKLHVGKLPSILPHFWHRSCQRVEIAVVHFA
jgi:hypothetical protein